MAETRECVSKKILSDGSVKVYVYERACSGRKPGRPKKEGPKVENPNTKAAARKMLNQLSKEETQEIISIIGDKIKARNNADPVIVDE